MRNTLIVVYVDGASTVCETTEAPRKWERLQSGGGALRNVAAAVVEGVGHDAATIIADGVAFLSGKRAH